MRVQELCGLFHREECTASNKNARLRDARGTVTDDTNTRN